MRILLDEQLPRQLIAHLTGHDARTVQQQGWSGTKNGELLKEAATAGFEIFLTSDQNIQFQQNLKNSKLLVVVLVPRSNRLDDLLPLLPEVLDTLRAASPGELVRVGGR